MKEMVGGCCVCSDERGWSENPLVYCDGHGCNVAVHQACYGIISVPSGPWFCRKCESQERAARVVGAASRKSQKPVKLTDQALPAAQALPQHETTKCELCPQKDGALKRTDTGGWCHVVCALFVPEAWFGNVQTMEPIILKGVPPERFNKCCYVCEEQGRETKAQTGACMQCNKNGCKQHFHVTCAQSQGLLCEEQGNYMDNVKYCGYCSLHYKKLKKDSHIKTIPAFKPIPADNATPEGTPEKSNQSRQDRRRERLGKSQISESANSPRTGNESGYPPGSGQGSGGGKDSVTDIKSTGKFTTANFRETTITPSPAHFDFSSPGSSSSTGGGGSTPTHERERKEGKKGGYDKRSNDNIDVYDSDFIDADKRKVGILGSPSGRSVAAAKESKFSSVYAAGAGNEKPSKSGQSTPSRTPPRGSGPASTSPATSTTLTSGSSVSSTLGTTSTAAMATTVTTTTAGSGVTTSTTSVSQSGFSYSFKNFLNSHGYQEGEKASSDKDMDIPPAKRPRSRSSEKSEKKKSKKKSEKLLEADEPPSLIPDVSMATSTNSTPTGAGNKAKTVKDLLAVTGRSSPVTPPSTASPSTSGTTQTGPQGSGGPPSQPGSGGRIRKPGKRKKSQSDGFASGGMPTLQPQGVYESNPFSGGAGTTPLTLASLGKQGAAPDLTEGLTNGPSSLIGPPKPFSSGNKGLLSPGRNADGPAQLPTSMEQLLERQWDQGSQFLMEQGQHFDIASLLNCLHQLRQENQRLEEHINNLTARRDQLLAVNARLSLPLTPLNALHPGNTPSSVATPTTTAGSSPEGGATSSHVRNPRTNSFLMQEHQNSSTTQEMLSGLSGRTVLRSPAHSQAPPPSRSPAHSQAVSSSSTTPTHNHLPPHSHSPAASTSSHQVTQSTPDTATTGSTSHPTHPNNPPGVTDISPGGGGPPPQHPPPLSEQQRQMLQFQHQQLMLNASLTPEQRQHLMYQIAASQQLPPGILAPHPVTASSTPLRAPPPLAPSHTAPSHTAPSHLPKSADKVSKEKS